MSERKAGEGKAVRRDSSRILVIAAVGLLIVIAIAGIVLAGRSRPAPPAAAPAAVDAPFPVPSLATLEADPASTAASGSAPVTAEVFFTPASDKVPAQANGELARFSDQARMAGRMVIVRARYLTGANKARDLTLARQRSAAIRHAIEANGVKGDALQTELVEMPAGSLKAREADRVEMALR